MNKPISEDLPLTLQDKELESSAENQIDKDSWINEIGLGVLGNIIWEIVICIVAPIVGGWKDVSPPAWVFGIIAIGSIILTFILRQYFRKLTTYHSYAHYVRYSVLIGIVLLGLAIFITSYQTLFDLAQNKEIVLNLKWIVGMGVILSVLIINYTYVNHQYRNIRRNKQQIDIRIENKKAVEQISKIDKQVIQIESQKILDAVQMRSRQFESALLKSDMDTAITATIIPFKEEKGEFVTYLMDNESSYKRYSWMFAGGHVKSSENETPDAIAVSRAKTELGLVVSVISESVRQDEMIENMTVFVSPNYIYRFHNPTAKCCREHGHEYHLDLVYLGKIDAVSDDNILKKCIEIRIPNDIKHDLSFVANKCNEAKNKYYRKARVRQKDQRIIPDYIFNMLYAAYCDYYDYYKGR